MVLMNYRVDHKNSDHWLQDYIDRHLADGGFSFRPDEAISECKVTSVAFKRAADRLQKKNKLLRFRQGLIVPIPPEYREQGTPPIRWFIDALMRSRNTDYCVGLLSAAAIHGATHQAVQSFQVLTSKQIKPIEIGKQLIQATHKIDLIRFPFEQAKTDTGCFKVSTPEVTAFDLVRFHKQSGGLQHVLTVLNELAENLDAKRIVKIAEIEQDISVSQRLGQLFSTLGFDKLVEPLKKQLERKSLRTIPLIPARSCKKSEFKTDKNWGVVINEELESDL